ncbi:hypothetical protein MFIFM68171_00185 [Madurella fahalii]|uniref:Uncharacterized protein n=1 Tax=Madurella fahalii TaxID=1157608 RepID=A0ABQ0FXB2_9PEZI
MSSPGVKQEPDGCPSDPASTARPRLIPVRSTSRRRESSSLTIVLKEERGEIDSSPARPFPRALHETDSSSIVVPSNGWLVESSSRRRRLSSSGPIPQQGTPQDRFRQAMLNLDQKKANAAHSGSSAGWSAPFTGGDYYPSPNGLGGFDTMMTPIPASYSIPAAARMQTQATPAIMGIATSSHRPSPMQILSGECQRRGFNPEWQEMKLPDGRFTCNVRLRNRLIRSNKLFDNPVAAKIAVAEKAVRAIWTWGSHFDDETRVVKRESEGPGNQSRASGASQSGLVAKQEVDTIMRDVGDAGNSGANTIPSRNRDAKRGREPANLVDQVRKAMGIPQPSGMADNSEAARAFLEGLAVGARLAGPKRRRRRVRSRSPSARRHTPRRYRERSSERSRAASPARRSSVTGDHYDGSGRPADALTGDYYDGGGRRDESLVGDYYNGGGRRSDASLRPKGESWVPASRRRAHSHLH